MSDIKLIIEQMVNPTINTGEVPPEDNTKCPICQEYGCECDKTEQNTIDMKSTTSDSATPKNATTSVFERLAPAQLNALMETLVRNKKQFNGLYSVLANEGFVPANDTDDYDSKRAALNEVLRGGKFTKHMLESLVEMNHLQVGAISEVDDEEDDGSETVNPESGDDGQPSLADYLNPKAPKKSEDDDEEPAEPTAPVGDAGEIATDAGVKVGDADIVKAKETLGAAKQTLGGNMQKIGEIATMFGFPSINDYLKYWNRYRNFGYVKKNINGKHLPFEEQLPYLKWTTELMSQSKNLTGAKHSAEKAIRPAVPEPAPVTEPHYAVEEPVFAEAKKQQLRGTGDSELQLRAGAKGRIFESRVKRLEPYKKIALLEFLENDPRMMDDKDYYDMSVLTGINEEELVLMRIEYENSEAETLSEMSYPVFGGKDVRGENEKNAKKSNDRDIKQSASSQETTEEKVSKIRNQKFSLLDTKDKIEQNGQVDQNRGMHTQIDVLNSETNNSQKDRYEQEADGVMGKRDPKSVKNDANVGDGKAGEEGVTDVGEELLKKGAEQPAYYATTANEKEFPVTDKSRPISNLDKVSQPIRTKQVNEDIDRMNHLTGYNANRYGNAKSKKSETTVFTEQLQSMRVLSESVETVGMPSAQQLAEMKEVDYKGAKARTDGVSYFDDKGKKLGECGTMEEASGHQLEAGQEIKPKQLYAGTQAKSFANRGYDTSTMNEGKDTGEMCTECGHKIWEVDGKKKCMCKGEPKAKKSDVMEAEIARQQKLAGMTEAKRQQLKHSKGNQLKAGTKAEEVIDEAKNQQLKHSKGLQLKAGTKSEEKTEV